MIAGLFRDQLGKYRWPKEYMLTETYPFNCQYRIQCDLSTKYRGTLLQKYQWTAVHLACVYSCEIYLENAGNSANDGE